MTRILLALEQLFEVLVQNNKITIMKKLALIFTGCLSATILFAQSDLDNRNELQFGLKVGGNLSNVWDEKDQSFEANDRLGLATGAFLHIPVGKYLGIQPEFIYSQKGFQGTGELLGQPYSFERRTEYIDIPILFSFKPLPGFSIVGGPQYAYLISQTDNFTSGPYTASEFRAYENDNIRKNTLGVIVGFDISSEHFTFSPRAGWDLQNNLGDGTSETPRYKNQWLQLAVGYRF